MGYGSMGYGVWSMGMGVWSMGEVVGIGMGYTRAGKVLFLLPVSS